MVTPRKPEHTFTLRLKLPADMTNAKALFLAKAALKRQFPNMRVNITNDQPPKETPNA